MGGNKCKQTLADFVYCISYFETDLFITMVAALNAHCLPKFLLHDHTEHFLKAIVSQPSKCLKFMTFWERYFVIHVEYMYLSETLETFYHRQFYKR